MLKKKNKYEFFLPKMEYNVVRYNKCVNTKMRLQFYILLPTVII